MLPKDKQEAQDLYWLQLAIEKDGIHPTLQCVHFTDEKTEAADGFRAHIVKKPLGKPGTFKLNHGKPLHKTPREIEVREDKGRFPEIQDILQANDPVYEFAISRYLLMEALQMPNESGWVKVKCYGPDKIVIVEDLPEDREDEPEYIAAVMPVHIGRIK